MYIEDNELRDLFKTESEEHLQSLDEGLLELEKDPARQETLQEVFRDAHSLKGAARMLGVTSVEQVAHRLEDLLGEAKRGDLVLTSEVLDRIYKLLDCIRKFVQEAVTGETPEITVEQALQQFEATRPIEVIAEIPPKSPAKKKTAQSKRKSRPTPTPPPEPIPEITEQPEEMAPASAAKAGAEEDEYDQVSADSEDDQVSTVESSQMELSRYKIDTIRVKHQRLDALMTQAGELTVTKIRIGRRIAEIDELINIWEEWSREANNNHFFLRELEKSGGNGIDSRILNYLTKEDDRLDRLGEMLGKLRNAAYEDNTRLEFVATELEDGIRSVRLLPMSTIFNLFPRMVRDLSREQGKQVNLIIEGGDTTADKRILEEMKDPLMHIIRNSIDHGIEEPEARARNDKPEEGNIRLEAYRTATNIVIEVEDDGQGLNIEKIKKTAVKNKLYRAEELETMSMNQIHNLIFTSGFSTSPIITDVSGRGIGMDVVRTNVERLKGTVHIESTAGMGCTIRIQLPVTLATTRVLIVSENLRKYALPVEFVETTLLISREQIFSIESRETINIHNQPISVARLSALLEIDAEPISSDDKKEKTSLPCIILTLGEEKLGILVDGLVDEQEVVLKPHSGLLRRVRNVSGATILGTGEVCMVLNPQDLVKSIQKRFVPRTIEHLAEEDERKKLILLVEDSITTRTQEKRILENAGYEVTTAVDGIDGFDKLRTLPFDAVISDVQMPNMDGLALASRIRKNKEYDELPIILVTSLASEEDKKRGFESGANAYITKGTFDQKVLLDTLQRLI